MRTRQTAAIAAAVLLLSACGLPNVETKEYGDYLLIYNRRTDRLRISVDGLREDDPLKTITIEARYDRSFELAGCIGTGALAPMPRSRWLGR
jgi:hypothetical protein